jgi:peptidoglycan/xylan/chitin deacetylase (PgdA/CDA1 family)
VILFQQNKERGRRVFTANCKLVFLFLFLIGVSGSAQNRNVVLLDMTARNAESTDANRYSLDHLLVISGLDFSNQTVVDSATKAAMIVCSSNIESTSFNQTERDSLYAFVDRGGILVACNVKDSLFFPLFGVSDYQFATTRYAFNWIIAGTDPLMEWINDPLEQNLKLADTSYAASLNTRGYDLTTGTLLAQFENAEAAAIYNGYNNGHAYLLGISWKDIVLRNQQLRHYDAARTFSNGFEAQTDVFAFFLRNIYKKHIPFAVWKHTSGLNSSSTLMITHDVDATTGMKMMTDFAGYEKANNIRATYFITTHYVHDSLAKDFYTSYTDTMRQVLSYGMEVSSHSVSHVPDFGDDNVVSPGTCGNNQATYRPFWNGQFSENVTICGETEVSKLLLENEIGAEVYAFRAGYLAYNKNLIRGLETNGYLFNCTHSANNVLTAFPFRAHYGLSMDSAMSSVYEIPNTISDVFHSDPMNEQNYSQKAIQWSNVLWLNAQNNATTSLLIHPNRLWKIDAEQRMLRLLPIGTRICTVNEFGNYWKARETLQIRSQLISADTLLITVITNGLPLQYEQSFVVDQGQNIDTIIVKDEFGNILPMLQSPWASNDIILHSRAFSESYLHFEYKPELIAEAGLYPNPISETATIELDLMQEANVVIQVFDMTGRKINEDDKGTMHVGHYDILLNANELSNGTYFYRIVAGGEVITSKFIVTGSDN